MTADPDAACPHENFEAWVDVNRLMDIEGGPVTAYAADIRVKCADCGEPFRWTGLKAGVSPRGPMCSLDETEMHAPIRPASADPDFGLSIPGYAVSWYPEP